MSPFEVVHGYKPRKPLDLLPMSIHTRVSESAEFFARRIQDLHIEITKQIQASNVQYKLQAYLHRRHHEFNVGDYVMIRIKPERFPSGTNRKLHARSARSFKVLQWVGSYAYVLDLPHDFGISSTFNIEDLVAYHKSLPILNDPFEIPLHSPPDDPIETSIPFTLTSAQKDNIDTIMDEQVVFNKNCEVQRFLVRLVGRPDSDCTWITRDTLQQIDPDLWEYYQSWPVLHSTGSSFSNPKRVGGDTRPTPQITWVYGRRRRRMTQPVTLWLGD